ncbi:hypothetical protein SANTM175S_05317 [Streptomyces antimycoticus]
MSSAPHGTPAQLPVDPGRGALVSHTLILAGRHLTKLRASPQIVVFSVLQPLIMMLLFMVLFAGAVSGSQSAYLQFLLPGMLAQNAAFMVTTVGQAINSDIDKGIFDRFRSLPIARPAPLIAHILGDLPRQAATTLTLLAFGFCIGFRVHTDPLSAVLAVALVLLVSFAFSWIALTIGLIADKPESVNMLVMILLFPMAFGSNTMVATDTLPRMAPGLGEGQSGDTSDRCRTGPAHRAGLGFRFGSRQHAAGLRGDPRPLRTAGHPRLHPPPVTGRSTPFRSSGSARSESLQKGTSTCLARPQGAPRMSVRERTAASGGNCR